MSQNREPPAYQEYASNILAKFDFRHLSLAERGLLYTLKLECWVNVALPADPEKLSRSLGLPVDQLNDALPALASFFSVDSNTIRCPELENYRRDLAERRAKQSAGGRKGARKVNSEKSGAAAHIEHPTISSQSQIRQQSNPQVPRQGTYESLDKTSLDQLSQKKLTRGGDSTDPWIRDYGDDGTDTIQ